MSDNYTNTNMGGDTLNQAAAHDTGLYDPEVHDNQIVAMYETEARARAARDTLISNGIPEQAIRITDREQDRFAGGVDYERNDAGLWGAIRSLFMPDEEAHGYAEGVNRGHAILVVQPDVTMDRHRIITVLEGTDPIDFDAKLEEWRQAGYSHPSTMQAADVAAAGTSRGAPSPDTAENDYMSGARADELPGGAYESRSEATGGAPTRSAASSEARIASQSQGSSQPAGAQYASTAPGATAAGGDETIQVVEERLRVGKREVVKGATRVRSYIVERPVEQQVNLHEERVNVDRRPVDRPVTSADASLFEERVVEARSMAEEAVVGKEARVVEEIALHKEATDRVETIRDKVRRTEVEVEGGPHSSQTVAGTPASIGGMPGDTTGTGGKTTTSTTGATSSGTNAPRK